MGDLFPLRERQMARISPFFPLAHGVPRVDDRRVVSGIVYVIRNGLQWKDAPKDYGPHKTLYNRFMRCDVAPNFYPAVSSFWRLGLPSRACGAAGADAEPLMLRSV